VHTPCHLVTAQRDTLPTLPIVLFGIDIAIFFFFFFLSEQAKKKVRRPYDEQIQQPFHLRLLVIPSLNIVHRSACINMSLLPPFFLLFSISFVLASLLIRAENRTEGVSTFFFPFTVICNEVKDGLLGRIEWKETLKQKICLIILFLHPDWSHPVSLSLSYTVSSFYALSRPTTKHQYGTPKQRLTTKYPSDMYCITHIVGPLIQGTFLSLHSRLSLLLLLPSIPPLFLAHPLPA
jgi:hypothetical protein